MESGTIRIRFHKRGIRDQSVSVVVYCEEFKASSLIIKQVSTSGLFTALAPNYHSTMPGTRQNFWYGANPTPDSSLINE